MIKTDRLLLRPLRIEDADDMFEYTSNPKSNCFLTWEVHTSVKQDVKFIENALRKEKNGNIFWGIVLADNEKLIGCSRIYDISDKHKRCEISYIINPDYSGKGYATEALNALIDWAFKDLHMNRVQALCLEENKTSEQVMKKARMTCEGTLRNYAVLRDDKSYSMKIYSRIKE